MQELKIQRHDVDLTTYANITVGWQASNDDGWLAECCAPRR